MKSARGMTLIEVLVALAITAIALLAGAQSMNALTHGAARQGQVLLAQLCADNALAAARLSAQMPAVGQSRSECIQAGTQFQVQLWVSATANPSFRRVEAQVLQADSSVLRLSTVIGRY